MNAEKLREQAQMQIAKSEEHRANFLVYEDKASQGAQEQLYLFGVHYGRASAYYMLAEDYELHNL